MSSYKLKEERIIVSLSINIMIVVLTIIASVMTFVGYHFMTGSVTELEASRFGMFYFFTIQSNIFMGIVALIFVIDGIKVLMGKKEEISARKYVLKLMSTTSVGLTFFVVFAYLGPISNGGILAMLMNSSLFFHLIIPVLSMLNFVIFEKSDKIKLRYVACGMIPTFLYGIYYLGNIFVHMEGGKVSPKYDWYWFVQNGVWTAVIVVPLMLGISYTISFLLWRFNKKVVKK